MGNQLPSGKEKRESKSVPYDLRAGKIKGSYLMEKVLSKNSKEKMLKDYAGHVEKIQEVREISLNEYLRVAGICYSAAFKKEAKSLFPPEMYKKWADGRDGGMLSISDRDDKKEFMDWLQSGVHAGSHHFEIVFSGTDTEYTSIHRPPTSHTIASG